MRRSFGLATLAVALAAAPAAAQDARSILAEMQQRRTERMSGVQDYIQVQTVAGVRVANWYERMGDGVYRMVPMDEILERSAQQTGRPRGQMTHGMADAYELTGDALRRELKREGFPADGPLDPRNMFDPMAAFIRAGADREPMSDGRAEAASAAHGLAEFARRAKFVGRESVEGRQTFHLRATGLQDIEVEGADDVEFELVAASLYVDADEYVPVRMVIEARAREGRRWMPMTIEKLDLDYRRVGPMYEPFEQVMRIGGMEEAMAGQMQQLKAQLEQMPPGMRGMIENQMRNAMKQFEAAVILEDILVNTGVPTDEMLARLIARPGG